MEEKRILGKWWLPSDKETVLGGVLTVDADGNSELELIDGLFEEDVDRVSMIHGIGDGRQITVLDSFYKGKRSVYAQDESTVEMYQPGAVLVGVHLESPEMELFDQIDVQVTNLTTWVRKSFISETGHVERDGEKVTSKSHEIKIAVGDSTTVRLDAHQVQLTLVHLVKHGGKKEAAWSRSINIDEEVTLRIVADSPRSWDGFDPTIKAVRDLITLASQCGAVVGRRRLLINIDHRPMPYTVDLYVPIDGPIKDSQRRRDMLFCLDDVDLETLMNKWVALSDQLGLPLDVLLGLDYITAGYYENRIFNVASAGEGFHLGLYPNKHDIDSERHAAIKAKVLEAFEGEDLDWVRIRVNSNHPGLKDRYLQLAAHPDQEAVVKLLTDIETWARWLKKARNAIGHLNTNELDRAVPESARFYLTNISKAFLHLVLLQELGLSPEIQRRAVDIVYSFLASQFKIAVEEDIANRR